jgi:ribosomal subunit interface protein
MQINIQGKFDLGDALTEYAEGKLREKTTKIFQDAKEASIKFEKNPENKYVCHIIVYLGHNNVQLNGEADGEDPYAAFNMAMDKIDIQLRKEHQKLTEHN